MAYRQLKHTAKGIMLSGVKAHVLAGVGWFFVGDIQYGVEDGRLTYEMIPDDYDWLLLTLLEAMDIAANEKTEPPVNDQPLTMALITDLKDQLARD